jgi:hypothetical protein
MQVFGHISARILDRCIREVGIACSPVVENLSPVKIYKIRWVCHKNLCYRHTNIEIKRAVKPPLPTINPWLKPRGL